MSIKKQQFTRGIILRADDVALEGISGELKVALTGQKLQVYLNSAVREVLTADQSQVVTNKTIDADQNTISNIDNADIKAAAGIEESKLALDYSTSSLNTAITDHIADPTDAHDASAISNVPAGTIAATDVQAAINELDGDIQDHINDTADAHDASAISNVPSGNLSATDVQAALNELQGDIDTNASAIGTNATNLANHLSDTTDAHDASAISVVPNGNLASTDVQAALQELQGDADTAASHIAASTDVHGIGVGNSVVGTGTSQTLTNKIITGADIRTPVRSDVKQDTKANLTTYATTASNGQLVFATDTKEMFQVVDGLLEAVGGGAGIGGVDILFTQTFEEAALTDFTQTGLSLSTSSPLHGEVSALMTHQNAVNQSFKQVIPVDAKFRGQAMTMRLNAKSNASAGNVTLNIYDETNAANIVASEQLQLSNDTAGALSKVGFTIPATCTSLSYTITALPEAGSPVTRVDDIIAELAVTSLLETSVEVPVVTEWQGYTPTFQGFGTPTAIEFEWRQVGQDAEIRGKFTAGTPTTIEARIGLPGGLTSASTALIPSIQLVGYAHRNVAQTQQYGVLIEPSVTYVTFDIQGSAAGLTKQPADNIVSTGNTLSFFAKVPCSGLSATTTKTIDLTQSGLVQNPDSTVTVDTGNGYGSTNTKIRRFSNVRTSLGSAITYSDSATLGASFTVNEDGIYSISYNDRNTTTTESFAITVNDSALSTNPNAMTYAQGLRAQTYSVSTVPGFVSWTGYLSAGDVVRAKTSGNANSGDAQCMFTIAKESSLKQVSVSSDQKIKIPTSELRFTGSNSRGAVATNIIRFNVLDKIRGDAFTVTNTANDGTFVTMRKAGKLSVFASVALATSSGVLSISKNQQTLTTLPATSETMSYVQVYTTTAFVNTSADFFVNVGDIIRICSNSNPSTADVNQFNLSFQEQDIAVSVTNTLPQFSESDSSVRVDTANGYGSTATRIRRFSNVRDNIGTDIEYVDSATNGASFTVKSSGIYNISYSDSFVSANQYLGISKNASSLTTNIESLAAAERLAISDTVSIGQPQNISWQGYLAAGDIIRPHTNGSIGGGSTALYSFTISKVGKPNVTGVDVTPFVNIPQNDVEYMTFETASTITAGTVISGALTSNTNKGIISYSPSTGFYTALKPCKVDLSSTVRNGANVNAGVRAYKMPGNILLFQSYTPSNTSGLTVTPSASTTLQPGEYVYVQVDFNNSVGFTRVDLVAEATSDSIITASESFSTDTANLSYASSSQYTLTTLANAPVGTFITFTAAASNQTLVQTTTAPTQTTDSMNTNGIKTRLGILSQALTAADPTVYAIQIGKGHKSTSIQVFKSLGKVTAGVTDLSNNATTCTGIQHSYDASTGILKINVGRILFGTVSAWYVLFQDETFVQHANDVYVVINASKSPALTGVPLLQPRIAVLSDVKATGSAGGAAAGASWTTRTLNTLNDPTGLVTNLLSNQFTLQAGKYHITASAPFFRTNTAQIRLRDVTNGVTSIVGAIAPNLNSDGDGSNALLSGVISISNSTTFELQYYVTTARAADGLGTTINSGESAVFSLLTISKV